MSITFAYPTARKRIHIHGNPSMLSEKPVASNHLLSWWVELSIPPKITLLLLQPLSLHRCRIRKPRSQAYILMTAWMQWGRQNGPKREVQLIIWMSGCKTYHYHNQEVELMRHACTIVCLDQAYGISTKVVSQSDSNLIWFLRVHVCFCTH